MEDVVFNSFFSIVFLCGFILLIIVFTGIFNLLYRTVPSFRRKMNRFFDSMTR